MPARQKGRTPPSRIPDEETEDAFWTILHACAQRTLSPDEFSVYRAFILASAAGTAVVPDPPEVVAIMDKLSTDPVAVLTHEIIHSRLVRQGLWTDP